MTDINSRFMSGHEEAVFLIATCIPSRVDSVVDAVRNVELLIERVEQGQYDTRPDLVEAVKRLHQGLALAEHYGVIADAVYAAVKR